MAPLTKKTLPWCTLQQPYSHVKQEYDEGFHTRTFTCNQPQTKTIRSLILSVTFIPFIILRSLREQKGSSKYSVESISTLSYCG